MKTGCYLGSILLIVTLGQSSCNDEEIPVADEGNDSFSAHKHDLELTKDYKRLIANVDFAGCYERKEKVIPLKTREDLDADNSKLKTIIPVEYVIVRGSKKHCNNEKDCTKLIRSIKKKASLIGCEPEDNFYVGGDGYVYEGRGWDNAAYWHLNGLRHKAITVQFFGNYTENYPSPRVIDGFRATLNIGVWLTKISKSYQITSMRELFNDSTYLGEKLDEHLVTWGNWANATYISSLWEYTIPKRLTFVFRSQWNAMEPKTVQVPITGPAINIMISDGGDRCINGSECLAWMKTQQTKYRTHYGDLLHNFYIGEGGEVFEGRGWDAAPHWDLPGLTGGLLSVRFMGSHEYQLPSETAINSFKQLVHIGVWLGRVSQDYHLFSLRQVYRDSSLTGEALYKLAEGWVPRWKHYDTRSALGEWQLSPFVHTSKWGADFPAWRATEMPNAVDYVIVYDGGVRCFSRIECSALLKKEQRQYRILHGNLLDNFYIGEDGSVYEGRGWNRLPAWHSLFVGMAFMTVKFMGSFKENEPTWLGWTAFNTLLQTGIDSGKISPNYRLITLRQTNSIGPSQFNETYSAEPLPLNSLESRLKEMPSWSNMITQGNNLSTPMYRNLIFPRHRWSTAQPRYPKLRHPIEYVVVGSVGNTCSSRDSCLNSVKTHYERKALKGFKNISDNFYIGGDGWVFEGRGWEVASQLNVMKNNHNFLFVSFLGNFQIANPSPVAMYGFHHAMESGMRAGKLAPDYKIVSIGQIFPGANKLGDMLSEDIKLWHRWSDNVPYSSGKGDYPSGSSIYVSRLDWNAENWTSSAKLDGRIRRVLVLNVGSRCFTRQNCTTIVRAQQNKSSIPKDPFVTENFYLGEDGHVYEGRGWDSPPPWSLMGRNRDTITVAFLGDFEKDLPSPEAIFAFQYLMKMGMSLERIGDSYRIESMKTSCDTGVSLGDALDREIKSWEMWNPSTLNDCSSYSSLRLWE